MHKKGKVSISETFVSGTRVCVLYVLDFNRNVISEDWTKNSLKNRETQLYELQLQ